MTKARALARARAIYSTVFVVAAGKGGRTWGYNALVNEGRNWTTVQCGTFQKAQASRAAAVRELVADLLEVGA